MSLATDIAENRKKQEDLVRRARELRGQLFAECRLDTWETVAALDEGRMAELCQQLQVAKWGMLNLRKDYDRLAAIAASER